jgi:hypothetical protein
LIDEDANSELVFTPLASDPTGTANPVADA